MSSTENSPVHRRPNVQILETLKKNRFYFIMKKLRKFSKLILQIKLKPKNNNFNNLINFYLLHTLPQIKIFWEKNVLTSFREDERI